MHQLTLVLMLLVLGTPVYAEQPERFELFVVNPPQQEHEGVTVYQVNGGDQLMAAINAQMQRDGVRSEEKGRRYVTGALKRALSNQAIGLTRAIQYRLRYFPALVIDGRYVIYGSTNPHDYDRFKKEN